MKLHGVPAFISSRPDDGYELPRGPDGQHWFSTAVDANGRLLYVDRVGNLRFGPAGIEFRGPFAPSFRDRKVSLFRAGRRSREDVLLDRIVAATFRSLPGNYHPGMTTTCSAERSEEKPHPAWGLSFVDINPIRRPMSGPVLTRYEPRKDEIWAKHPYRKIRLSSQNRVRFDDDEHNVLQVPKEDYATFCFGGCHSVSLHRLVCEAFHGLAPIGKPYVDHIDGDPSNNHPYNLRWTSPGDNRENIGWVRRRHKALITGGGGEWRVAIIPLTNRQVNSYHKGQRQSGPQ